MATVEPDQTAKGKRYRVRYRTPDHKPTQKRRFTTKRDALLFASTVEVAKAKGEYIAPSLGRMTIGELAPAWLSRKEQATAPSHYRMLESAWRVHVQPRWAKVPVVDVDLLGVEAWIGKIVCDGAGSSTV